MAQNEAEPGSAIQTEKSVGGQSDPESYCLDLVKKYDPDIYYASRYANASQQEHMITLAAWQIELRQVVAQVSTPPLGEIRLQWWRDALDEILHQKPVRSHPVVLAMASLIDYNRNNQSSLDGLTKGIEEAITARARLLYDAPFVSADDFLTWAKQAEGNVFVELLSSSESDDDATDLREQFITSCALGIMTREGARLAPTLDYRALQEFCLHKWTDIKNRLQTLEADTVALWLPAALIRYYAMRDHGRPATVRRHLVYLRTVMLGKL